MLHGAAYPALLLSCRCLSTGNRREIQRPFVSQVRPELRNIASTVNASIQHLGVDALAIAAAQACC